MITRRGLLLACAPILLLAADPWKDKKASDWSSKDATRILTNSPWAKSATAEMDFSRMAGGSGGAIGGPGSGVGNPPGGGMGGPPGGGGMGGPGGGMEPPKFTVRWESAVPVREAAAKIEDVHGTKITVLAKEFYVISVSGTSMMPVGRRGQDGQTQRPQPDLSRMQERIVEATLLRIKGQDPVAPIKIEVLQGGMSTLFLFPRSREISADTKEVSFETSMGPMTIKTKFSVKEMMYEGRPAL